MTGCTSVTTENVLGMPPHSCATCVSPEYEQAEEIIKHSGLQPENWGYLLHEIANALINRVCGDSRPKRCRPDQYQ